MTTGHTGTSTTGLADLAERTLILQAILGSPEAREGLTDRLANGVDSRRVVDLARRHAVLPSFFDELAAGGHLARLESTLRDDLRDLREQEQVHNMVLLNDLAEVLAALERGGVRTVALKGAALLSTVYRDSLARHTDDLDLFVPEADAVRAAAVLREIGFHAVSKPSRVSLDGALVRYDPFHEWQRAHHHPYCLRSPRGSSVELHSRLSARFAEAMRQRLSFEAVWRRSSVRDGRFGPVRVPAPVDQVQILSHHVHEFHPRSPFVVARHLLDLAALRESGKLSDAAQSEATRSSEPVARSFQLLEEARRVLRDGEAAPLAGLAAVVLAVEPPELSHPRKVAENILRTMREDPARLRRVLFPAREYLAWKYGVPADRLTTYAYHLHRLLGIPGPERQA